MAQEHLDRLTAVDASFLAQEGPSSHMHVGAVMVFEGPPPSYDDFLVQIRGRLHLVPRYRQKLAFPPLRDRPAAVGRRPELQPRVPRAPHRAARPGLRGAAAQPGRAHLLPAARPLQAAVGDLARRRAWSGNRFALISKTHHALVDGVAGVDLATVLFDLDAGAARPSSTRPRAVGAAAASRRAPSSSRRRAGAWCARPFELAGRRGRRRRAPERRAAAARARPPRASARSSGPG